MASSQDLPNDSGALSEGVKSVTSLCLLKYCPLLWKPPQSTASTKHSSHSSSSLLPPNNDPPDQISWSQSSPLSPPAIGLGTPRTPQRLVADNTVPGAIKRRHRPTNLTPHAPRAACITAHIGGVYCRTSQNCTTAPVALVVGRVCIGYTDTPSRSGWRGRVRARRPRWWRW